MAERSLNKVTLIGRLGRDPEVKYLPSGRPVANFSIATSDRWQNKEGEWQEKTEWHRIVMFGKIAETAGQYLSKGSRVYIEGSLRTREWTDKEGQKKTTTEIDVREMIMLTPKGGDSAGDSSVQYDQSPAGAPDDDIPF